MRVSLPFLRCHFKGAAIRKHSISQANSPSGKSQTPGEWWCPDRNRRRRWVRQNNSREIRSALARRKFCRESISLWKTAPRALNYRGHLVLASSTPVQIHFEKPPTARLTREARRIFADGALGVCGERSIPCL